MAYTPKTYEEIKEEITINIIQNVDTIVDINEGSVIDIMVSSFSTEFETLYNDLNDINDSLKISTAEDEDLDEIGDASGILRLQGTRATALVTFRKSTPMSSTVTIPQGTLVSTNPNANTVINFATDYSVDFLSDVSSVNVDYYNGIKYYKVDNRHFQGLEVSGYVVGVDFDIKTDFDDVIINSENFELLDDCDETTDWTVVGVADAITTNATYYQHYDKSLSLKKTNTTSKYFGYDKTLSTEFNCLNKQAFVHYRITSAVLAKVELLSLFIGSSATDTFQFDFLPEDLSSDGDNGEWNRLTLNYKEATQINGNPDIQNIDYIQIYYSLNNATDTITGENDCLMDFWFTATSESYKGYVIEALKTNMSDDTLIIGYNPLSYDIDCTATVIGEDGNVAIGEINYKVSNLSNIDTIYNYGAGIDGSNVETDDDYRNRIRNAAALRGASTVPAIEAAITALSFVKDCVVIDLPEESITGEKHTYDSATEKFKLNYEQALDNSNLSISGYVKDTDFQLNVATNEISFGIGGSDPTDDDVLEVDYDVQRLGKLKIIVTGQTGTLTSGQLEDVSDVALQEVSAGISYTISAPTYTATDVEMTINVSEYYNETDVKVAVENMITSVFNAIDIGQTLKIIDLINSVSFIPGVLNISSVLIDSAATDKDADIDEILSEGTVTVNIS